MGISVITLYAGIVFGSTLRTDDGSVQIMLVVMALWIVALPIYWQVKKQLDAIHSMDLMKEQISKLDERLTKVENKQNTKLDNQ